MASSFDSPVSVGSSFDSPVSVGSSFDSPVSVGNSSHSAESSICNSSSPRDEVDDDEYYLQFMLRILNRLNAAFFELQKITQRKESRSRKMKILMSMRAVSQVSRGIVLCSPDLPQQDGKYHAVVVCPFNAFQVLLLKLHSHMNNKVLTQYGVVSTGSHLDRSGIKQDMYS
ncbi:hypothetical protein OWV82_022718 [Melia azedarach]|uniref:Uncharacterized protein n=1 Tax=Melia azedarach TaxID=155640 RepID=A0ACC1WU26_MELAZ|nr:hypothetical protein OWV82_022718 [Melia azedarach]